MKIEDEKRKLEVCNEEKDLSITFDSRLSFDSHISNISKKANQILEVIRRTFTYMDKNIFSICNLVHIFEETIYTNRKNTKEGN